MLLPGCKQRGEHPLSWLRREEIRAWVSLVLSLSSQKDQGWAGDSSAGSVGGKATAL